MIVRRAFTLIEALLALGIAAALLAASVGVLFGAIRMRRAATILIEEKDGASRIHRILQRDLANAVVPSGLLAGPMLLESDGDGSNAHDTLEFCTTTGTVGESVPWGDVRAVEYLLDAEAEIASGDALPFVRRETLNLLSSTEDDADTRDTILVAEATGLSIECYADGAWAETWDSTTAENANPMLFRITVTPLDGEPLVCLQGVTTQPRTAATAAAAPATGGDPPPAGQGGTP